MNHELALLQLLQRYKQKQHARADASVSEAQHRAMEAAAHGESTLGIPKSVGEEFVRKDEARADANWITVHPNGKDSTGQPALIGDDGTVLGGMGGKFNGKNIKDAHGTERFTSHETNAETEARHKEEAAKKEQKQPTPDQPSANSEAAPVEQPSNTPEKSKPQNAPQEAAQDVKNVASIPEQAAQKPHSIGGDEKPYSPAHDVRKMSKAELTNFFTASDLKNHISFKDYNSKDNPEAKEKALNYMQSIVNERMQEAQGRARDAELHEASIKAAKESGDFKQGHSALAEPLRIDPRKETEKAYAVPNENYMGSGYYAQHRWAKGEDVARHSHNYYPKSHVSVHDGHIIGMPEWLAKEKGHRTQEGAAREAEIAKTQAVIEDSASKRYHALIEHAKNNGVKGVRSGMRTSTILDKMKEAGIEPPESHGGVTKQPSEQAQAKPTESAQQSAQSESAPTTPTLPHEDKILLGNLIRIRASFANETPDEVRAKIAELKQRDPDKFQKGMESFKADYEKANRKVATNPSDKGAQINHKQFLWHKDNEGESTSMVAHLSGSGSGNRLPFNLSVHNDGTWKISHKGEVSEGYGGKKEALAHVPDFVKHIGRSEVNSTSYMTRTPESFGPAEGGVAFDLKTNEPKGGQMVVPSIDKSTNHQGIQKPTKPSYLTGSWNGKVYSGNRVFIGGEEKKLSDQQISELKKYHADYAAYKDDQDKLGRLQAQETIAAINAPQKELTQSGESAPKYHAIPNKPYKTGVLLTVPFDEKEKAKALGARWSSELHAMNKKHGWHVPEGVEFHPDLHKYRIDSEVNYTEDELRELAESEYNSNLLGNINAAMRLFSTRH